MAATIVSSEVVTADRVADAAFGAAGGWSLIATKDSRRVAPTNKAKKQKTKPMPRAINVTPSRIIGPSFMKIPNLLVKVSEKSS